LPLDEGAGSTAYENLTKRIESEYDVDLAFTDGTNGISQRELKVLDCLLKKLSLLLESHKEN